MKHRKKLITLNIILPLIMFSIILLTGLSEKFMNIITITFIVGWALPFLDLILTGFAMITKTHRKLGVTLNLFNVFALVVLIIFVLCIMEKKLIIILIEYIIILIISVINIIALLKDMNANPDKEIEEINKIKLENNGVIK